MKRKNKNTKCINCLFFESDGEGSGSGICRRYPPVPLCDMTMGGVATHYPCVADFGWCGEFKSNLHPHVNDEGN